MRDLLAGLARFREVDLPRHRALYRRLAEEGQHPGVLFVACSDSRVVPSLLTGSGPGELFVVRTVANIVAPPGSATPDPTVAALEFAVAALGVRDVVVCGHSRCGGVAGLYDPPEGLAHLRGWLEQAAPARLDPGTRAALDAAEVDRRTGQRNVVLSLERLAAHPLVVERRAAGDLALHGWYLDVAEQDVSVLDPSTGAFVPVEQLAS